MHYARGRGKALLGALFAALVVLRAAITPDPNESRAENRVRRLVARAQPVKHLTAVPSGMQQNAFAWVAHKRSRACMVLQSRKDSVMLSRHLSLGSSGVAKLGASVAENDLTLAGTQNQLSTLTDAELDAVAGGWRVKGPLWGTIEVAEA